MRLFNFPTVRQNSYLSDDVIQNDSVELCDPDEGGCGYAKKSCVCSAQGKEKEPPAPNFGDSDSRGIRTMTDDIG